MNSNFDILISFRTPSGFKVCAQYFLGRDPELAETVFAGLSGKDDISDNAVLHLDLVETRDELPVKVKTIGCRLSELCANCQHITRELFRANAISAGEDHPF
ncbi:hypothetical protein BEL04_05420 [Mucilaginibacter sp. PPCGB 2223]|uniref:hypothetical protein n=1 Tax=Mucilaginibacter sp. PPCGB 2223 TaxID=1886027 RepID=UPI0008242AF1|nr:hypothetical protein [Mucilaginibacter sp. PPCGB 2223]OCX53731.1 hypothetical protein BEL04_05420 [Mucilaginibacter sp. PPCGB 2223]